MEKEDKENDAKLMEMVKAQKQSNGIRKRRVMKALLKEVRLRERAKTRDKEDKETSDDEYQRGRRRFYLTLGD